VVLGVLLRRNLRQRLERAEDEGDQECRSASD
jgi:hypothetical protein